MLQGEHDWTCDCQKGWCPSSLGLDAMNSKKDENETEWDSEYFDISTSSIDFEKSVRIDVKLLWIYR